MWEEAKSNPNGTSQVWEPRSVGNAGGTMAAQGISDQHTSFSTNGESGSAPGTQTIKTQFCPQRAYSLAGETNQCLVDYYTVGSGKMWGRGYREHLTQPGASDGA